MLAAWVIFLLSRPAKMVWMHVNKPRPLSLEQKVQIAQRLEANQNALKRLNHLDAHPKDLYLYLFQLAITTFLCFSGALFIFLMAPPRTVPSSADGNYFVLLL